MKPIPLKVRRQLENDPRMKVCARRSADCFGRIEWHHAITGMGRKKFQDAWSIIALCVYHHRGAGKDDEKARFYAFRNVSEEDLKKYKLGTQMIQEYEYLKTKYA